MSEMRSGAGEGITHGVDEGFLRLEGITKRYGDLTVIDNFSLSVRKGEFISILGPSGCGKTTMLRMVAGFIAPDGGSIFLDGARIDALPSHRRDTAMVFQNYALFPHMTVFENIAFGLRMRKVPLPQIKQRVAAALNLVRLPGYENRYPRELSGGQQQRVALARAVVLDPPILLLDEPLSNLDAKLRKELREEFLEVHRLSGITTLLVTHDLEEAFAVSNRVAVMNQGRLEQYARPSDIFTRPETSFVSEFVGHTNVIEGGIEKDDGQHVLRYGNLKFSVPAQRLTRSDHHARYAVPVPSIVVTSTSGSQENSIPAKVKEMVFLGSIIRIVMEAGSIQFIAELPCTAALERFNPGADVFMNWNRSDMIELP